MKKILTLEGVDKRNFGLDFLRAFTIIMVMLLHGMSFLSPTLQHYLNYSLLDGVSIFFVLSGFLIGGIFIRELEKKKKEEINGKFLLLFLMKRWFRTLPNYYFILSIIIVYFIIAENNLNDVALYKYFLFVQNFASPHPLFFPEAWSLSIEEWFYLIIPFLTIMLLRILKRVSIRTGIFIISGGVILTCTVLRFYKFINFGIVHDFETDYKKIMIYRLDSIIYGVLASVFFIYYQTKWKNLKNILAVTGLAVIIFQQLAIKSDLVNSFYMVNFSMIFDSLSIVLFLPFF